MKFKIITIVLVVVFLFSCSNSENGYRIEGNKVVYQIPWNAGHGIQIKYINANPSTFEIVGKNNINWAKDDKTVFWRYHENEFLSSATFELLGGSFAKDKNHVVCGLELLKEADITTFKVVEYTNNKGTIEKYGIDKKSVYFCFFNVSGYRRIESDSIDTFQILKDGFYKDSKKAWWGSFQLKNVDVNKIEVLEGGYAKDGKSVFYHNRIIIEADSKTFKVTGDFQAKDKNHKYEMEDRIE